MIVVVRAAGIRGSTGGGVHHGLVGTVSLHDDEHEWSEATWTTGIDVTVLAVLLSELLDKVTHLEKAKCELVSYCW